VRQLGAYCWHRVIHEETTEDPSSRRVHSPPIVLSSGPVEPIPVQLSRPVPERSSRTDFRRRDEETGKPRVAGVGSVPTKSGHRCERTGRDANRRPWPERRTARPAIRPRLVREHASRHLPRMRARVLAIASLSGGTKRAKISESKRERERPRRERGESERARERMSTLTETKGCPQRTARRAGVQTGSRRSRGKPRRHHPSNRPHHGDVARRSPAREPSRQQRKRPRSAATRTRGGSKAFQHL
jgi:hypothetical protein